ncbi:MAG: thioesterase [Gammaproteobacteria bacterium]|nr:thioesterase [Gammaproteobacteria bacterium]MDD9959074.1 thioesterase [Gammaproteobacteria bacterium]
MAKFEWDRTNPFLIDVCVSKDHIDGYGHVSNHFYIAWMTDCMFAHSAAVGLPDDLCAEIQRGMAVRQVRAELLGSAYQDDKLKIANWIISNDGKLRASRAFQIINATSGKTLVRAEMDFVCTNLENGKPVKMPAVFVEKYCVKSEKA